MSSRPELYICLPLSHLTCQSAAVSQQCPCFPTHFHNNRPLSAKSCALNRPSMPNPSSRTILLPIIRMTHTHPSSNTLPLYNLITKTNTLILSNSKSSPLLGLPPLPPPPPPVPPPPPTAPNCPPLAAFAAAIHSTSILFVPTPNLTSYCSRACPGKKFACTRFPFTSTKSLYGLLSTFAGVVGVPGVPFVSPTAGVGAGAPPRAGLSVGSNWRRECV